MRNKLLMLLVIPLLSFAWLALECALWLLSLTTRGAQSESADARAEQGVAVTPELITQLEAQGGMWTGKQSQWGSFEIYSPLGAAEPIYWCTPRALAGLLDEWRLAELSTPRLRSWLGKCQ